MIPIRTRREEHRTNIQRKCRLKVLTFFCSFGRRGPYRKSDRLRTKIKNGEIRNWMQQLICHRIRGEKKGGGLDPRSWTTGSWNLHCHLAGLLLRNKSRLSHMPDGEFRAKHNKHKKKQEWCSCRWVPLSNLRGDQLQARMEGLGLTSISNSPTASKKKRQDESGW